MIENYGIIGWIVIGLLAGGIAKLLMPGKDPGGCVITILLGIAGALLAGFIGKSVGWYDEGEAAGFIAAIVGAFLILLIYRLVLRRRGIAGKFRSYSGHRRFVRMRRWPFFVGEDSMRKTLLTALALGPPPCRRSAGAGPDRAGAGAADQRDPADVSATGEVTRVPDLAIISAGVQTLQPTATAAIEENAARMERVRAALKRAGIEDRDIQTSSINLNPEYHLCQQPAAAADRLSRDQHGQRQVPRPQADRGDPRRAGGGGREPDQRAEPDHRQARGGARRGADQGDRQRPGPRRPICPCARHARGAAAVGQRGRRLSCAAADADGDDGRSARRDADTKIDPGTQQLQVNVSMSFELQ